MFQLIESSHLSYTVGTIISPILQVQKLRQSQIK